MKKVMVLMVLALGTQQALDAQQKFALVIGNGAYTAVTRLNNPVNDANDMKDALESLGFRQGRNFEAVMVEGIKQTLGYRDSFFPVHVSQEAPAPCYLLIFDRRPDKPAWTERIKWIDAEGLTVLGC